MIEQLQATVHGLKGARDVLSDLEAGKRPDTAVARRSLRRMNESIATIEGLIALPAAPENPLHDRPHRIRVKRAGHMQATAVDLTFEQAMAVYRALDAAGVLAEVQRMDRIHASGWLTLHSTFTSGRLIHD